MPQHTEDFFAPCPRGLETVLTGELNQLGAPHISPTSGGVGFRGPFRLCYQVNLHSRIASRVLWRVFHGRYRNEADIYQATISLPWPVWFSADHTIKVKVSAQRCPLTSLDFITLRIKDAVCDAFIKKQRLRPHVSTKNPDIRIHAFLDETFFTLYLDTSGEALFKRGWRRVQGEAPIRENLAAGILQLAGWSEEQTLLDPMCGSGTILTEAAQMVRRVAPGIGRTFAFQKLKNFDQRAWEMLCRESRAKQRVKIPRTLYGSDRDSRAIRAADSNARALELETFITLKTADVLTVTPPTPKGILISNPPYGVRMGESTDLEKFYPLFGNVLKQRFFGWTAYLFTADKDLPKMIRLSPSKRIPLFNGDLDCRLYEFKLVQGSNRRPARLVKRKGTLNLEH